MEAAFSISDISNVLAKDNRLKPTHLSLYWVLFYYWNVNECRSPITISRRGVMQLSKIKSIATYHKCIKELQTYDYIRYEPSYNYYKGSKVYLILPLTNLHKF